jgi:lipase chaperone LimK
MDLVDLGRKRVEKVLDVRTILQTHHTLKTLLRLQFSKEQRRLFKVQYSDFVLDSKSSKEDHSSSDEDLNDRSSKWLHLLNKFEVKRSHLE